MNNNTILVVEDDAGLREALIDTLEMSGIACVAADSAEQAMLLLKKDSFSLGRLCRSPKGKLSFRLAAGRSATCQDLAGSLQLLEKVFPE